MPALSTSSTRATATSLFGLIAASDVQAGIVTNGALGLSGFSVYESEHNIA